MDKRVALVSFLLAGVVASAHAAGPDFYGVKMKSEDFARDLMVRENNVIPDFSNDRPGIDRRIYAYGYASTFFGRGRGMSIQVFNHSDETIATERLFRECTVVAKDGRRYDRSENDMQWQRDKLKPGESATFWLIFRRMDLRIEDVQMVIFSFDLGRTNIFLFPMRGFGEPTEPPARLSPAKAYDASDPVALPEVSGPPSVPATALEKSPSSPSTAQAPEQKTETPAVDPKPAGPHCMTPASMVKSIFSGFGGAVGSIGRLNPFARPAGRPAPAPSEPKEDFEDAGYHFSPEFKSKVQEGEKQVKEAAFVDRPWSIKDPRKAPLRTREDYPQPEAALPRVMAQVVQVDKPHGFIVINAGSIDGVRKNDVVSVLRNGRRIGKAMVRKVREKVSAAGVLPEWQTKTEIKAGDQVELA